MVSVASIRTAPIVYIGSLFDRRCTRYLFYVLSCINTILSRMFVIRTYAEGSVISRYKRVCQKKKKKNVRYHFTLCK